MWATLFVLVCVCVCVCVACSTLNVFASLHVSAHTLPSFRDVRLCMCVYLCVHIYLHVCVRNVCLCVGRTCYTASTSTPKEKQHGGAHQRDLAVLKPHLDVIAVLVDALYSRGA